MGKWKTEIAATYTFKVDGMRPDSRQFCRKDKMTDTAQLAGSSFLIVHHETKTFHFKQFRRLIEGALASTLLYPRLAEIHLAFIPHADLPNMQVPLLQPELTYRALQLGKEISPQQNKPPGSL